jgi:hypothetical protein
MVQFLVLLFRKVKDAVNSLTMPLSKQINILVTLFLLKGVFAIAQPHPILDNFTAYLDNDKIILKWTIISGSTCNGIRIYRAGDSISFNEIGSIAGICGNSSTPTPYEFSDEAPISNQVNYYRLELGTQGYSTFISIEFIKLASGNYLIRPNPVVDVATVYFQNDSHLPMKFTLTNASGNTLMTQENIIENYFVFSREELLSGLYIFTIEYKGDVKVKGKIIL